MKTRYLLLVLAAAMAFTTANTQAAGFGISFGVFYDGLAGHGEWIGIDGGTYAWRPMHVGAGWRPYFEGRWLWTDDGWYWDSDEPWAWATYHYGRWYYDDYYGWIWIPGYDWAPAWVEWRYGGDYVGWAPLGPYAVFSMNFGVHYLRHWVTPYHYWSFVDCRYVTNHHVNRYVYRSENNTRFIGRTRTAGSVRFEGDRVVTRGPDVSHVERRGNIRVERTAMLDVVAREDARVRRTNGQEQVGVFRPRIEERRNDLDVERPPIVRNQERMPSLDTRSMDIRQRQVAREEGRTLERMPSYRLQEFERRRGRLENEGSSDNRELKNNRSFNGERRFNRENDRMLKSAPREESERKAAPRYDRPTQRSAPDVRYTPSPRSDGGGSRSGSSHQGGSSPRLGSGSRSGGRDRR